MIILVLKRFFLTIVAALAIALAGQSVAMAAPASSYDSVFTPTNTFAITDSAASKLKSSWSWYVTRASGILAAFFLALLVLSGVGLLTGLTYRMLEPLPAWAIHRAIALSFGSMVIIHIVVLLFDKFIGFSPVDILVPFASDYMPVKIGGLNLGSLYIAFGVFAFYLIIAIIVSSLLWMQSKPKPWKKLHLLSYLTLILVFFHGLFTGTDLKRGFMRFIWILGAFVLLGFILTRLRRAHTIGDRR